MHKGLLVDEVYLPGADSTIDVLIQCFTFTFIYFIERRLSYESRNHFYRNRANTYSDQL